MFKHSATALKRLDNFTTCVCVVPETMHRCSNCSNSERKTSIWCCGSSRRVPLGVPDFEDPSKPDLKWRQLMSHNTPIPYTIDDVTTTMCSLTPVRHASFWSNWVRGTFQAANWPVIEIVSSSRDLQSTLARNVVLIPCRIVVLILRRLQFDWSTNVFLYV